nr:ankyrin repeat domain-containing protein [Candidatus Acidoferrales bacterium]
MPPELPDRPNLEHLKKQAKALLREFQQKKPAAIEKFNSLPGKIRPRLSDAQYLIAREYGFETWAKLKERVESLAAAPVDPVALARKALRDDDAPAMRKLLNRFPELKANINEPIEGFDSPAIIRVRSRAMLDALLDAGADINAKSQFWAGGFDLLDCAEPALAAYAIERGARVTIHSAARLGLLEKLRELVEADPELVHARGGDGQTPLHFAVSIEIAEYLLDHGAEIDARDVDHESTAAQYMIKSRQSICRFLIQRGSRSDILMAAALGDIDLARRHLKNDPECVRMRVSDEYFPMISPKNGGTILQWELGWYVSAPQIAKAFGHADIFNFLMEQCPADEKLVNACWLGDESQAKSLLAAHPNLSATLSAAGRRQLAHAARNNNTTAVRLMIAAGLPVTGTFSQHHATPLHWAAWHGNVEMIGMILACHPEIENRDNDYHDTPLGWAIYGSEHGWAPDKGDYAGTVDTLLNAGATLPDKIGGSVEVRKVLRRHGVR